MSTSALEKKISSPLPNYENTRSAYFLSVIFRINNTIELFQVKNIFFIEMLISSLGNENETT